MRRLLSAATLCACLFASAPASAQNDPPGQTDGACDAIHCQWVSFDDLDVFGDLPDATIHDIVSRDTARFGRRAALSRSFSPELQASLDDAALDP